MLERERDGTGFALTVPPPPGSDLAGPLYIEETDGEVTISLNYSHIPMSWPPQANTKRDKLWADPLMMVEAIINETVLSRSGWIDDRSRVGSLQEVDRPFDLLIPNLQRVRIRSWKGAFDRDISYVAS